MSSVPSQPSAARGRPARASRAPDSDLGLTRRAAQPTKPGQSQRHLAARFHACLRDVPLSVAFNTAALAAGQWLPWTSPLLRWTWTLGLGGVLLLNLLLWWHWGRPATPRRMPLRAASALASGQLLVGLLYGAAATHMLPLLDATNRMLLVGLLAAFWAGGAWLQAPLARAALGWVLGLGLSLQVGLLVGPAASMPGAQALSGLGAVYTAFLGAMVGVASRQLRARLVQADQIDGQLDTLDLLLRDFEANASDWLWELDTEGRLVHASVHLSRATAQPPALLLGQPFVDVLHQLSPQLQPQGQPPNELAPALLQLTRHLAQPKPFAGQLVPWLLDGGPRWWSLKAQPLYDEEDEWAGWRGVASDVTAVHLREAELHRLAHHDSLTGLANRHQLMQSLRQWLPRKPCALLLLDLDNFKTVNDSLGHTAGDELLRRATEALRPQVPPGALLARLGGDEFALLLPDAPYPSSVPNVTALAERLREALALPLMVQGQQIDLRVSLGLAFAPHDADEADGLLRCADLAMYAAKTAGRDRLHRFQPALAREAERRLVLAAELLGALQRHELQTVYQPKFKLDGGELVGFEALVRWQHPVHGTVAPSLFVPLAEETGMVMALGEHVLRQTCMEAAHWPAPLSLAVNVSAKQLEAGNLHLLVQRCLADSGLPPERLELELTESAFLHHNDRVLEQLMHLRRMGVRLALDDFGTGYSSLAYLQQLPLTNLKIDRSFVIALSAKLPDRKAVAIVQAVIALAQGIGATTTAEGLDTPQQIERLRAMGCELGQGYGLCRPIPADQARSLMAGGPFATVAMSNPGAVISRLALQATDAD
jgi:diguanylate cyclase (GGDEF)-like protein